MLLQLSGISPTMHKALTQRYNFRRKSHTDPFETWVEWSEAVEWVFIVMGEERTD